MTTASRDARHSQEEPTMPNRNGTTATSETNEKDIAARIGRAREGLEDVAGRAKATFDRVDRTLQDRMRENPILVLGIAVGVGYMIGRIFSRLR
jgi:hypothetical protein